MLPVVLYGCETWSLTLTKERSLRLLENEGLRKAFGPEREEVTGRLRKLHTDNLHVLCSSSYIIRKIWQRKMVACMGEKGNAYRILMGKSEGKNPLGRFGIHISMHRNIITDYSQQEATFLEFTYFYKRFTCFRRFLHPSSGAHHCTYSYRYCQPILLLAATVEEMAQCHLFHGSS
jgi:hypothetical protein